MSIGQVIQKVRTDKGLNTVQLARLAGVSEGTIRGIEAGKHSPKVKTLVLLFKALGLKISVKEVE